MSEGPRVTIAGGGIAGLTAALRLAQRGYRVTVYEQKPTIGGNLGSRDVGGGVHLDVYPHMYLSWYHNFWSLLAEITKDDREERFEPFSTVKQLRRGNYPSFSTLTDAYSPGHLFQNMFAGIGPPADMFVFAYASLDLLAERLNPTMRLEDVSVNGFLQGRPYMTEEAAAAYNSAITTIWALPGYLTSAEDYRTYLAYCFADPEPSYWMPRGSALDQVIRPLKRALKDAGVRVECSTQLTRVVCDNGRVTEIGLRGSSFDSQEQAWVGDGEVRNEAIDELVLAVPPLALSRLVRAAAPGERIVDALPELADVSRLRTQQIPLLHVYFTRRLRGVPPEPVGLFRSRFELAFTDISQTWEEPGFANQTVLALSSSDVAGLPGTGGKDDALAMLVELADYLDFDPGQEWGESPDIDWDLTRFNANRDAQLFVNQAGTDAWRPVASYKGLTNLSLAGDFCQNHIGMTTIESAVTTGLQAAQAIVDRRGVGKPVDIFEPASLPDSYFLWFRYAWAPYALAAKWWSAGGDYARAIAPYCDSSDTRARMRNILTPSRPPRRQRRESRRT
jgi:NAD(P)-binding Rossmann-like domain